MNTSKIENEFRQKVCSQVSLYAEGLNRYRVFSPFMHSDGDHFSIVLKNVGDNWYLTDEGVTLMRLTTEIDYGALNKGNRRKFISEALAYYNIEEKEGELVSLIPDSLFGDALYSFVQAIMRVSDVEYLSKERIKSTFLQDFRDFINDIKLSNTVTFDWYDRLSDPNQNYTVDCRIETDRDPLFIFALGSDDKVRDTTINLYHFKDKGVPYQSIGIFEDQTTINRKALAKITDAIGKQFSLLRGNENAIKEHFSKVGVKNGYIN